MEKSLDNPNARKNKILRSPPALPPKPPNLISKCKINTLPKKPPSEANSADLEPDYCSISELNLPQNKVSANKISVVAEVHCPTSNFIKNKISEDKNSEVKKQISAIDETPNLVVKKCVEKLNIQLARHTSMKPDSTLNTQLPKKKNIEVQIPKLPQVSEIIIPDDPEENEEKTRITQDNYVKNNTQIMQAKPLRESRKPILMGSSVSSLISGFNNHQIINNIKKNPKPESKKMFSSFENLQNLDKHFTNKKSQEISNFDLSQNFEEFKLDDCEIEEYDVEEELEKEESAKEKENGLEAKEKKVPSPRVDYIRATDKTLPNLKRTSIEILKKQLELQRTQNPNKNLVIEAKKLSPQPTYEHFLECTGLSSKSILTPSRTLSNHKNMLKPKDVKLRSKVKANANIFEKHGGSKIKYWSEPFV